MGGGGFELVVTAWLADTIGILVLILAAEHILFYKEKTEPIVSVFDHRTVPFCRCSPDVAPATTAGNRAGIAEPDEIRERFRRKFAF